MIDVNWPRVNTRERELFKLKANLAQKQIDKNWP